MTQVDVSRKKEFSGASVFSTYLLRRLLQPRQLMKLATERLTEPLHINIASIFIALFGSFRSKVDFDIIIRQQYAFPILHAADIANEHGLDRVTIIEFGVANGAGLINMCKIAQSVSKAAGVEFQVFGFDTGAGMPPAMDHRDHPEMFQEGDFPMDFGSLSKALPPFAHLIIGDVSETIPNFLGRVRADAPIAFVSMDVDYYSSTKKALSVFSGPPDKYLPCVTLYLDDIGFESANPWCGELLAVSEFNAENELRKISPFTMLRALRLLKNPRWIDQMYTAHILDHPLRTPRRHRPANVLKNEYLV